MNRRLLAISLVLAVVLSLAWWAKELTESEEIKPRVTWDNPDSYAQSLVVKRFDKSGFLFQLLRTPRMDYFEKRDVTELLQPVIWQYNPSRPPWKMQAEYAISNHRDESIYLPGRVIIDRQGKDDFAPYHIVTRDLMIETQKSFASTSEKVTIDSDQQQISALGMRAWLNEPSRLKLLHQVRGHYEFK
ncbi:MAG: LPS export ABC transporter periplasmic protein LptC [Candidatus Thiodiazotropha sp.]